MKLNIYARYEMIPDMLFYLKNPLFHEIKKSSWEYFTSTK